MEEVWTIVPYSLQVRCVQYSNHCLAHLSLLHCPVQVLDLSMNKLSGSLPSQWLVLTNLQHINLDQNTLIGSLPFQWATMSRLQVFTIANNNVIGTLPFSWQSMTKAKQLIFTGNKLSGSIPRQWGRLAQSLVRLGLSGNVNMTGCIPQKLFEQWKLGIAVLSVERNGTKVGNCAA
jgi:hypothetical protein